MRIAKVEFLRAVDAVMDAGVRPYPYRDLTETALAQLGPGYTNTDRKPLYNILRLLDNKRQRGEECSLYTGDDCGGLCLKRHWVIAMSPGLVRPEYCVQVRQEWIDEGENDAKMRAEHIIERKQSISPIVRRRVRRRGLIVDSCTRNWFREMYPEFYEPPANLGKWKERCDYDFKLLILGVWTEIDAFGPNERGNFRNPGNKKAIDLHLAARLNVIPNGDRLIFRGTFDRETFASCASMDFWKAQPIHQVLFKLNCAKHGFDHDEIKSVFKFEQGDSTHVAT